MEALALIHRFIFVVGYLIMFVSILPLLRSDQWYIRIFDYPRSQKFWISLTILIAHLCFMFRFKASLHDQVFVALMIINQLYLLTLIWSYTKLAAIQMENNTDTRLATVKLLIANVFQENRSYQRCIRLIEQYDPDIFLLVETDEAWSNAITGFEKIYPYQIINPQPNTYGLVLYSKIPMVNHSVRFLIEPDVPSIVADFELAGNKVFRLYGLHPKPPVPGESKDSTERDAEILLIGKEAKRCKYPVIVAGDLNDVAWSYTTKLFLKVSGLLDPRIGRGFFSTFHAQHRLLRWPLDHVFCSVHFCLHHIERLPDIGSDHFPIFLEVALANEELSTNKNREKTADSDDHKMANEKIADAK